ncbi:TonB-dependent receptor [Niabella pedocola]|uniref:TonB-dependent receptor n=1 Tax=Niabella pedocola TaxID=1752077 RepID=A0ABS8PNJ1_9BACT|nr:TonB-dependent receptor [Niabella pedocola]MCD2421356.1 TonB-dependent receptor [Niabella pedocola]
MKKKFTVFLLLTSLFTLLQKNVYSQEPHTIINTQFTGHVYDSLSKLPLDGATVLIKGTTNQSRADEKGHFNLRTGQKLPFTIIVSFVGYETREIYVTEPVVTVPLERRKNDLGEVVVVGYGTQKRSSITGSVASVSKTGLSQPAVAFDNLLQGSVSGVAVTQSSGQPGSTATIRIRGGNSINFGNDPLYVIDGFIVYNNNNLTNTGASSGSGINALSTINPSDIESIDILKDAAATAIYGSRGANGVVIITTKKGRKGRTELNYSGYFGKQEAAKTHQLLNGAQWASLINDINKSDNQAATFTPAQIEAFGEGYNWQHAALRGAATQNHELSISGGDEKSRFLISGNYFDQDGVILNTGFRRYSGRINYERELNSKFTVAANVYLSRAGQDKLSGANFGSIGFNGAFPTLVLTPSIVKIWNEDGSYNNQNPYIATPTNALRDIVDTKNETQIARSLANAFVEYRIIEGLVLKSSFGMDQLTTKQNYYAPSYTAAGYAAGGIAAVGNVQGSSWLNENTLTYSKNIRDRHAVNVLLGYTTQYSEDESTVAGAQKFASDLTEYNNLSLGGTAVLPASDAHAAALNSFLGRINYTLDDKYSVSLTQRADGSSRLGKNNKWGFFPSVGVSWNAVKERFLEQSDAVSNLKLRASYGQTGNSEVPPYSSLSVLAASNYFFNGALVTGVAPTQLANENLKWETTTQWNLGIDAGFFKNRISITADVYGKKTSDLLLFVPFPLYTGYNTVLKNAGSVSNRGIEFSLNTDNIRGRRFSWKSSIVFAANRNKVLNLGDGVNYYYPVAPTGFVSPVIVKVGLPVSTFWGYRTDGLLTAADLAANVPKLAGVSQVEGDRKYVDANQDGVITTADKVNLGNAQPRFTFGFTNNLAAYGFDLSVFLQGTYGNKVFNFIRQKLEIPTLSLNASASLLDRWSPEHPEGKEPRATNSPVPQVIDRYIEDASFLRVKNITLGYTLPAHLLTKYKITKLRFYITGQNLITATPYSGLDPEANLYDVDNTKQGIDYGIYPSTKTVLVGLNITI